MRALHALPSLLALSFVASSCHHPVRRFPLVGPMWTDSDQNHVPARPEEYVSGLYADAVDKTFLWPLSQAVAFSDPGEALNVNALDEVPNSSWFQNRIGRHPLTPEEAARGSCTGLPLDPRRGPWLVTAAKTEGVTPGFFIKAPDGHRYLLKFDGPVRPQRASAADAIGAKIYHAAGYFAPCNEVVYFRRDLLRIAPGATAKDAAGHKAPLTGAHVDQVLSKAFRLKDGRLRAGASRFLPGKPLGPHKLEGLRADDPNDVIPHEDRRELRAARLMAAWLNHFDIREQNSLDIWVEEGGRRFVRHYQLDFGDSFGSPWTNDRQNRRVGHAYYLDLGQMAADFLALGAIPRPWHRPVRSEQAGTFGYFGWERFVPSEWKAMYPVPAFSRMTWRDALWLVRIIVRFTDEHIRAIVKTAKLANPKDERYLIRALIERRNRIAEEYLRRHVPLARFRLVRRDPKSLAQSLCFEDLAIRHAGVSPGGVVYKLRMRAGERLEKELGWLQFQPDPDHPHRSCVLLPVGDKRPADLAPPGARDDHPLRYGVLTIHVQQRTSEPPTSIEVHLYDLGPVKGYRIVGIVRPTPKVREELI